MSWYLAEQFKHKNIFFESSTDGRRRIDIMEFFAEFVGKEGEDFVIKRFVSSGIFHVYTCDDTWQVTAKLVERGSILKALSRTETRKDE